MAITKIWDIQKSVKSTLEYVANKDKTETITEDLQKALTYLNHDTATEEKCFVTGINCNPQTSYNEMLLTKQKWFKTDGIQAFHAVQSFSPGEVTPALAHQIGVELAHRLWGKRFEVVVATHLDKNHIHSHFIINSVSFKDGKRYYDNKDNYRKLRTESDIICQEYGLSVVTPKGKGKNHYQYKLEQGQRDLISQDVDTALEKARTLNGFLKELKAMGYEIKQGKHIAIKPPWAKGYFRLYKLKGDKYADENIIEIITQNYSINWQPFTYATYPKHEATKLKGFKALYFKYMYMLGILPKENPNKQRVHFYLKEDLLYMDEITKQSEFITRHNLETEQDIQTLKDKLTTQYTELFNERKCLYGKVKRCRDIKLKAQYNQDVASITDELSQLRQQLKTIEQIEERSKKMEENLSKVELLENETRQSDRQMQQVTKA